MPIAGKSRKKPQRTLAARRASGSDYEVRLAKNLTQAASANAAAMWILCPWLDRFPKDTGVWLSVLAAHDANEGILKALPVSEKRWPKVYAGVFAVDTLRSTGQLVRCLKSAGIGGVINFPSTSFIDSEAGAVLNELSLGIDREIEFLQTCSMEGLRIAGVTNSREAAERLVQIGVDFIIAHGGPPTRTNADPSLDVAMKIEGVARGLIPVIPLSRVHRSDDEG
jgi:predicted TIM-barrel enzyme